MLYPIKVITLDISLPISDIAGVEGYMGVQLLVTFDGQPVGYCKLPIHNNEISRSKIIRSIIVEHGYNIMQHLLRKGLANPFRKEEFSIEGLLALKPVEPVLQLPLVTVAVCTRNRTEHLGKCLKAIGQLDYPNLDIVVVDNAPSDTSTEQLVKNHFSSFRYIRENNPGLNWARNRAVLEAKGEIMAYTDDDVLVDSNWVKAIGKLFAQNPEVKAVTGLVVPAELETEAQVMFEAYGGFGRGFERKWHQVDGKVVPWQLLGTGQFGTGANMAFRKSVFSEIGLFDPALDVGTCTNGGGDLEMFFRVLKHGHTLVYEPAAMVRHCHRKSLPELQYQIANNSKGLVGYMMRSCNAYPDQRYNFFRIWLWYLRYWTLGRMVKSYLRPSDVPVDLHKRELIGCFSFGLFRKAKIKADGMAPHVDAGQFPSSAVLKDQSPFFKTKRGTALRVLDLSLPIEAIDDITEYPKTRLFLKWQENFLAHLDVANYYAALSSDRIIEMVTTELNLKLIEPSLRMERNNIWETAIRKLGHYFNLDADVEVAHQDHLSPTTASVVIATFDRPTDLHECLVSLCHQETSHRLEIIVVDNHPASGLTPPVVELFPEVILIQEERKGLSYARNAGIIASTGDIIISTDDDVILPAHWAENLVKPFARRDVAAVTGNVLPHSLENDAQHHFELYGGLGRGYEKKEYNSQWFGSFGKYAVPTWSVGACANVAFRSEVFKNNKIGLLKEALGPGMPSGVGEDTYLFYKILKTGFTIIYEPNAYVWHKHRKTNKAFRKQLYNYSKGHVSYHLVTGIQDKDWRGLFRLAYTLPKHHLTGIIRRIIGRSNYPVRLILIEITGNFIGPVALLLSWIKVKRLGKSDMYPGLSPKYSEAPDHGSLSLKREKIA